MADRSCPSTRDSCSRTSPPRSSLKCKGGPPVPDDRVERMRWIGLVAVCALAAACTRAPEARQYEVRGQVLAVNAARGELLVDHEDIKGFMPAMTMSYKVQNP